MQTNCYRERNMRHRTKEEREREAALIAKWQPWGNFTGPGTAEDKAPSSQNTRIHCAYTAQAKSSEKELSGLFKKRSDDMKKLYK